MPLNNFGTVNDKVMRAAQPDESGIITLSKLGCRTIVKLNYEDDNEVALCEKYSITLQQFPIPTFINHVDMILTIVKAVKRSEGNGGVLVHCTHGRDRTGLIIGAYRILYEGWTVKQADDERKVFGVEGLIKMADMDMELILAEIYKQVHNPAGS